MKKITTVSIVDDEADLREHIAGYLSAAGDIRCKSAYATAEEALEHLPGDKPDVILMDINLGGMDGIECVRRLKTLKKSFAPCLPALRATCLSECRPRN